MKFWPEHIQVRYLPHRSGRLLTTFDADGLMKLVRRKSRFSTPWANWAAAGNACQAGEQKTAICICWPANVIDPGAAASAAALLNRSGLPPAETLRAYQEIVRLYSGYFFVFDQENLRTNWRQ